MEKNQNKKGDFPPHPLQNQQQQHYFPSGVEAESVILAELFSPESCSYIETFLRPVVREEVERKVESHLKFHNPSSRQLNDDIIREEEVAGSGVVKLKLRFVNNIPSVIFTGNDIEAENGEALQVALCDTTDFNNPVEATNPLSSALIEFVVLNGEFCSSQRDDDETRWTLSDFNESVLTQREGDRPLIVGDDRRVRLKNGVALIKKLSFPCNSSRNRSKMYGLGARIIDKEILAKYPRIGEAVSKPFRVKDHRGVVNKKHHPPKEEDEVWRLEGIGKNGKYHKRLTSKGIRRVDGFLKAYKRDEHSLRKLLGKVPDKLWTAMVDNALECVTIATTFEAMGCEAFNGNLELGNQKIDPSNNCHGFSETSLGEFQNYDFMFEDYPPLLSHGEASTSYSHNHEVENASTYNQYYQGSWTKLVPKPK